MADKSFELEYVPHHSDVLAVARQAARFLIPKRRRREVWFYLLSLVAILMIAIHLLDTQPVRASLVAYLGHEVVAWLPLILLVPFLFGVVWLTRWLRARNIAWLEEQAPYPPVTLVVADDRITWNNAQSGSWMTYSAIDRLFLMPRAIGIIYFGHATYIPRSLVGDDAALQSLLNFMLERLSGDARAKSLGDAAIRRILAGD